MGGVRPQMEGFVKLGCANRLEAWSLRLSYGKLDSQVRVHRKGLSYGKSVCSEANRSANCGMKRRENMRRLRKH